MTFMTERTPPNTNRLRELEISEWLRQSDRLIREGRYVAADDLLQKILTLSPENDTARSYQERIQILVKQLGQRVGLSQEMQTEVRKYRDLIVERRSNRLNSSLLNARKMLEDGYLKKAYEQASLALALDPENSYAGELLRRVETLQRAGGGETTTEHELQFCSLLKESWKQGKPSQDQEEIISSIQVKLSIPGERRLTLERGIRNGLYREALIDIWNTGGIAAFSITEVELLRGRYAISRIDHSLIEADVLKAVRKNRVRGTILLVDEDNDTLLELATKLRAQSYAVIAAGTLDEAFAALGSVTVDAVISEVNFSDGVFGFDLFEFVRSQSGRNRVPFIFMSAVLDRTTLLIGKRLGVDDLLTKPVDTELLVATLQGTSRRNQLSHTHLPPSSRTS